MTREQYKFLGREQHYGFTSSDLGPRSQPEGTAQARDTMGAGGQVRRHVTIDIPAPVFPPVRDRKTGKLKEVSPWINENDRKHRFAVAKKVAAWRKEAAERSQGIPQFTGKVHIIAHIFKKRGGIYDPNNLNMSSKACVDGLVDSGVLAADDYHHVIGPDHRHGGVGNAEIVLEIIELKEDA